MLYAFSKERRENERRDFLKILGFLLAFFTVGAIFAAISCVLTKDWPKVIGKVTESRIEKTERKVTSSRGTTKTYTHTDYVVRVTYAYKAKGEEFEDHYTSSKFSKEDRAKTKMEDDYPVGKKIQISYNPDNPTESRIGGGGGFMGAFMMLAFACLTGFGAFKLITIKKPEKLPPEDY